MRDPSMEQTAAGLSTTSGIDAQLIASSRERQVIRALAQKVLELACRPEEEEKRKLWTNHNDLQKTRPLIFCDPENGWNEIVTQDQIQCSNPLLRVWEMALRKEIFWGQTMKDDKVIEVFFYIPYNYTSTGYGLKEETLRTSDEGSCVWIDKITDYEQDLPKLTFPDILIDYEKTNRVVGFANELLGDILTVKLRGVWWWSLGMTWDYIKYRKLEDFMIDILMYPEWVHKFMDFLCKATHRKLDFLESSHLLSLNSGGAYVGSGGFGWTTQLPRSDANPEKVKTMDMWGFAESQETIGIDPDAYGEFIFPYEKTILERFGLNCYGCCEPIDPRWHYVKQFPRLRRISVSPWANIPKMSELLHDKYIMSIKPSPTPLSMRTIDKNAIRTELRQTLQQTKNCHVELIMKDNHTLGKNPMNAINWCRIAKEEAMNL